jgi:hypothetical protein
MKRNSGERMKKLSIAIILGLILLPAAAMAQRWVEPYVEKDGSQVDGHWVSPQDSWQRDYKKPGTVNPMTGQFNTYGRRVPGSQDNTSGSYFPPSSSPESSASNPYAIPGSSPSAASPNPYAIPGSSPMKTTGAGR